MFPGWVEQMRLIAIARAPSRSRRVTHATILDLEAIFGAVLGTLERTAQAAGEQAQRRWEYPSDGLSRSRAFRGGEHAAADVERMTLSLVAKAQHWPPERYDATRRGEA